MKFSEMIYSYRKEPTEEKEAALIEMLLSVANPEELDGIVLSKYIEWHPFGDSLKVKRLGNSRFAVAEVFVLGGRFICYAYLVDISQYTAREIDGYIRNCAEFDADTKDDYFTAAAIAATFDENDAKDKTVLYDEGVVNEWLNKIEKELW